MQGTAGVGGSINLSASGAFGGGSIDLSAGGGSINTRGTGSIGLGNSGTRTTLTGTATADRAISLPNASGTLGLSEPSDSTFRIVGSSDATKKVAFEVDTNISASTTRTFTAPNRSGTMVVSDTSAGSGSDVVNNIVSLTQAEYNAIGSPDAATLYLITDP